MIIKSPLRYPGGKTNALKFIISTIPSDIKEYREPFLGGGSVFFGIKQKFPYFQKYWINDLEPNVFNFWKQLQTDPQGLTEGVESLVKICGQENERLKTKLEVTIAKEGKVANLAKTTYEYLFENLQTLPPSQRAVAYYFLNRSSFSGIVSNTKRFSFQAYNWCLRQESIKQLHKASVVLSKNVFITNNDFQEVIEEKGERVFLFVDPPYALGKIHYYGRDFQFHKEFDHERLAKTLLASKHKWVLTYNDCDCVRKLYNEQTLSICPLNFYYSLKNRFLEVGKGQELLISNFKIEKEVLLSVPL